MVIIEPFVYQQVTAFKERIQMVSKINEIVNTYNKMDGIKRQIDRDLRGANHNQLFCRRSDFGTHGMDGMFGCFMYFGITFEIGQDTTKTFSFLVPYLGSGENIGKNVLGMYSDSDNKVHFITVTSTFDDSDPRASGELFTFESVVIENGVEVSAPLPIRSTYSTYLCLGGMPTWGN